MNIKFKSTKQELPKHKQYILYIKRERSHLYKDTPMPTFAKCEWSWDDGSGCQLCHNKKYTMENPPKDYQYLTILDEEGDIIWTNETNKYNPEIEHFWWIYQKEFDKIWKKSKH